MIILKTSISTFQEDKESETSGYLAYDNESEKSEKSEKSLNDTDNEEENKSDDENENSNEDSDREEEQNEEEGDEGNGDDDGDGGWWTGAISVKEVAEKIIQGNVDIEVPSQVKLVRIFTSSTFTGML